MLIVGVAPRKCDLIVQGGKSMNSRNLFAIAISATLALATSSAAALDQNDPAVSPLLTGNGADSPPSLFETTADQSPCAGCCDAGCCQSFCCPRWTASAGFIILDRIGGTNQTLVSRVPGTVDLKDLHKYPGAEVLDGNDFHEGFSGGPSVDLIRHGDSGYDFELSFFRSAAGTPTEPLTPSSQKTGAG